MPGGDRSLNNYLYKTLTEQYIVEWIQKCLSGVSDDVTIPGCIVEHIKSLSDSLAEFISVEKYKHKQEKKNISRD